jgi:hypothetical protein
MVLVEDIETQRKGSVGVLWGFKHGSKKMTPETVWKQIELTRALPMRVAALHLCQDNHLSHRVFSALKFFLDTFTRLRIRSHYGTSILFKREDLSVLPNDWKLFALSCSSFRSTLHKYIPLPKAVNWNASTVSEPLESPPVLFQ